MEVEWLVKRENSERVRDRFELANSFGVQLTVVNIWSTRRDFCAMHLGWWQFPVLTSFAN